VGEGQTYTNIQDAIDNATEGDEVLIHEGSYEGGIVIDVKGITVRGEGQDKTHIYGITGMATVLITADEVDLKDLRVSGNGENDVVQSWGNQTEIRRITIYGGGTDDERRSGLHLKGQYQTVNSVTTFLNQQGFFLEGASHSSIVNCIATNNGGNGFFMSSTTGVSFGNCISIYNKNSGFENFVSTYISYEKCHANYNSVGFGMFDSDRILIQNCSSNFNQGKVGWGTSIHTNALLTMYIQYSEFIGNSKDGLNLRPNKDVIVKGCTVYGNGRDGIYLEGKGVDPGSYEIRDNLIMDNTGPGIEVYNGYGDSSVVGNDMVDNFQNKVQAFDNSSTTWYEGSSGNHWSDHTSPDSNGDGIVDTPYSIAGTSGSKDMYPLVSRVMNHPVPVLNGSGMDIDPPMIVTPIFKWIQGAQRYYVQNLTAIDLDTPQEDLTWTVRTDHPGLSMRGSVLSGYCAFEGVFWVNVSVSDGIHNDHENFTLVVGDRSNISLSPRVLDITRSSYYRNESLTIDLRAYDPDTPSSALFWSLRTDAEWLSLKGDRLTGTPFRNGTYWFEVTVSDGNNSDTRNFSIIVMDPPIAQNTPPELSLIDLPTAFVGNKFKATLSAYDADGDDLDWQLFTDVAFLTLSGNILSGIPNSSDIGNHSVRIVISDGKANALISFTVKVMDEIEGEDIYDIIMEKNTTSGKVTLSLKDLFGKDYVDIVEIEWYVDGEYFGNGTSIELNLGEGDHTIKLRFKDSDGQWYEVVKTIGMGDDDEDTDPIYLVVGVSILLLLLVVTLTIAILVIVRKHRRFRVEEAGALNPDMDSDWGNDGISVPGKNPELRSGPLTPWKGSRGRFGPDPGHQDIYGSQGGDEIGTIMDRIRSEALSEMRPSSSSLKRSGMRKKLRDKFTGGGIDRELYEELRSFIDDNVGE